MGLCEGIRTEDPSEMGLSFRRLTYRKHIFLEHEHENVDLRLLGRASTTSKRSKLPALPGIFRS